MFILLIYNIYIFFISIKFIHNKFKVLIFSAIYYVSVAVYEIHNICNKIKLIRQFGYPTLNELNIYVFTETTKNFFYAEQMRKILRENIFFHQVDKNFEIL